MDTDTLEGFIERFKAEYLPSCHTTSGRHNSQGCFQIDEWRCQQDLSIERVKYYSPDPNRTLREIEYEGWRRHVPTRRMDEGPRFIFHIRPGANSLKIQADLARLVDDPTFREIGCWLEPISMDFEDPILAVNFCENSVEQNAEYVDELFYRISKVEQIPEAIIINLKSVIAHSCVERFKDKLHVQGFKEGFEHAIRLLRYCSLKGVSSPFHVAALFCQENGQNESAIVLIRHINKSHWQYEEARMLERSIYHDQIETLLSEIENLKREKLKLQEELFRILHESVELSNPPIVEREDASKNDKEEIKEFALATSIDFEEVNKKAAEKQVQDIQHYKSQSSEPQVNYLPEPNAKTHWHLHITEYHRPYGAPPIIFTRLEKFRQPKVFEIPLNINPTKPKITY